MQNRFPKAVRLSNSRQFEQVFRQGKRRQDRHFVVIASVSQVPMPRLGLAISKRRAPRAVDRNRIKRIVRESFRQHQAMLPNVDIVVLACADTATAGRHNLHASLSAHWQTLAQRIRGTENHG